MAETQVGSTMTITSSLAGARTAVVKFWGTRMEVTSNGKTKTFNSNELGFQNLMRYLAEIDSTWK